jgi:hypothetical protein
MENLINWNELVNDPKLFCDVFSNEIFDLFQEKNEMYAVSFRYNESCQIQGKLNRRVKDCFENLGFVFELKNDYIESNLGKINVVLTW